MHGLQYGEEFQVTLKIDMTLFFQEIHLLADPTGIMLSELEHNSDLKIEWKLQHFKMKNVINPSVIEVQSIHLHG